MLDVTRLRVLVAVARYGSVTAAARALNYAQPSVSHHLARLEAETGIKLIQRAGRGIRLTDAGRLLAERAAEVIGRLAAARGLPLRARHDRAGRRGHAPRPAAHRRPAADRGRAARGAAHAAGRLRGRGAGVPLLARPPGRG